MSRIGKVPVAVPEKVEVKVNGAHVAVKGPNGNLEFTFNNLVNIELKDGNVVVTPKDQTKECRSQWGTTRTIISNMIEGVTKGFSKKLEFNGVGYKAVAAGKVLQLNLGYSHQIDYQLPESVTAKVTRNIIEVSGPNKELVGHAAAKIRSFRQPEPYKGKGIKYADEVIIRKAGKSGKK